MGNNTKIVEKMLNLSYNKKSMQIYEELMIENLGERVMEVKTK